MLSLTTAIFIGLVGQAISTVDFRRSMNEAAAQRKLHRTRRQVPTLATGNRDVLFVLDQTVGPAEFMEFLRLTNALITSFCGGIAIGKDRTRVGVITFDSIVRRIIDFDDYFARSTLLDNVKRLRVFARLGRRKACIADALEYSLDNLFTKSRGARVGNRGTAGMIILLTQGCDGCNATDLGRVSSLLQQHGITLVVFQLGNDNQCAKDTRVLGDGNPCFQLLSAKTLPELKRMTDMIYSAPCIDTWRFGLPCRSSYQERREWPWTEWGKCSVSCGGGLQTRRKKSCSQNGLCSSVPVTQKCNSQRCPVCKGEWTAWFDRDNPSGNGDYEELFNHRKERKLEVCISPSGIDGRVKRSHTNWYHTRDIVKVSPSHGLSCINKNQKHGLRRIWPCEDYEVRFCCPKIENRKEIQFVAKTFLQTVLTISGNGGTSRRRLGSTQSQSKCTTRSYSDSSNNLRMTGRDCKSSRRKRQASPNDSKITKRDVLFLIDESGSVGNVNFEKFKRLAQAFVSTFCGDINIGEDKTRVGVLSFDSTQHDQMNFNDTFSKANILTRIDDVSYDSLTAGSTCLIPTLDYTRESMFTPMRGARMGEPGTEQVLILLTDGCANCKPSNERPSLLESLGERFSQQGVAIITYLVGSHSSSCIDEMKSLADGSYCYQKFRAYNWDEVDVYADAVEAAGCSNSWMISPPCP